MSKKEKTKFITNDILVSSIKGAFVKLDPRYMMKNPVMFVVEIGFVICTLLVFFPHLFHDEGNNLSLYNAIVALILFVTLLFANFAESVAEGRGKAQAETLKKTKKDTKARLIYEDGTEKIVSSSELQKGDIVLVKAGELIPNDGEIIEGIASVDESAITGESAPVTKESGGDFASVTGGTTVVSDWIKVEITSEPGHSFLDKMISMVEGASRQKTPNEIALNTLLVSLTIIFLIVIVTLYPMASYLNVKIPISTLIALTVCLIPTTIGALLSAIGIAGMDRVTRFNVIAMSGKAVEACGDVDTMILDKTGTITFGNRLASDFINVDNVKKEDLIHYSCIASLQDDTPEGKSTVDLAKTMGCNIKADDYKDATFIEFTAASKMSGVDLVDGTMIRKGAGDAIIQFVKENGGIIPEDLSNKIDQISKLGGTPLVVCVNNKIYGVIYLKDTVKPGLRERFERLRKIGIKTIMCTGDNPLTAATIAAEAGVDGYIAECKPEDKIETIKKEQSQGKIVAMTGDGTNDAPALAQADVGIAMNSGTTAAKEAANMVDLDSDPTKILEVVEIGKQLLITRGSLTTFSIANDIAKYFAIIPAIFITAIPQMSVLNIMGLSSPLSAILSALIFNAIIIPCLIPLAMKGVKYKPMSASKMLGRNMMIYGLGGVICPFVGIKIIDLIISPLLILLGL
ncbi:MULTISPECIES: potassium-transporting ATPase subunit KdpB [Faecalicoccus]|uniref:Potassium-transporting ATPase ATP-binding subunit n=1 Tax=Faecalicoccus pleomorphus TaxID=1323 RepID=A0AAW6CSJ4_9FIRM|nr:MULTISPECIES: potassium-transporting ATPase subunit KdpB [Faecalicoccus]MDB7981146.1 potassium-transporting ATPase subunit KdpB [Faecalicoccus pleomorphus]MDB7982281.1 potassium-transporting ATPase subunit KdpB [Faecalicoccus pleomorphus]